MKLSKFYNGTRSNESVAGRVCFVYYSALDVFLIVETAPKTLNTDAGCAENCWQGGTAMEEGLTYWLIN